METRLQTYDFPVVLEPDQDAHGNPAWHAYCPALAEIGAATSGRTKEEALRNLDEVLHMIVQELIEEGRPIPGGSADQVEVVGISSDTHIVITA
jgi:predicted RNase H-like HicB family nuclease